MSKQITVDSEQQKALGDYIRNDVIVNFDEWTVIEKLALLKETPASLVKSRTIAGKDFKYVDYKFSEKALNFVFNFHVSTRILKQDYLSYKEKDKDVTEAECTVEFTFTDKEGAEIVRTVVSGHKGYKNPATTRADIMKSAISKAWTVVARTFGIGADLQEEEKEYYDYIVAESEQKEATLREEDTRTFAKMAPKLSTKPNF